MTFLAQICPEMGKLPNYVWYFGSNNVEGVAEILVEAESSWVEVDGAGWRWVHGLVTPKVSPQCSKTIGCHIFFVKIHLFQYFSWKQ